MELYLHAQYPASYGGTQGKKKLYLHLFIEQDKYNFGKNISEMRMLKYTLRGNSEKKKLKTNSCFLNSK
jgi:hypothetical protein